MAFIGWFLLFEELENEEERLVLYRERRMLRDKSNPFDLPELVFKASYRLSREVANYVFLNIAEHMQIWPREATSIPTLLRFFCALNFLAHGSYQKSVATNHCHPMSQPSVSNCVREVIHIIVRVLGHQIKFPTTAVEKNVEKTRFAESQFGFPGIIGCIDCTHIGIVAPPADDGDMPGLIFYNRKSFYSLNVQIICNWQLKILNINARFPGSVHDSAIWQLSTIKGHLQNAYRAGERNTYLIGDSGYALEPWLLTPVLRPVNNRERSYNQAHRSIRNCIERVNGVLKQRFRCILKHRILHYGPITSAYIVYACAILHNICIDFNDELDDYFVDYNQVEEDENEDLIGMDQLLNGREIRNTVINNYF